MARSISTLLLVWFLLGAGGCGVTGWPQREGIVRGDGIFVIHAPGIMGTIPSDRAYAFGLVEAGVQEVRRFEWTGPLALANLMDTDRHERKAHELVDEITRLHAEHPDARIILSGHSGGTRIILRAVELLDDDAPAVEQVWLFAPAVRPDYPLEPILDRVPRVVAVTSRFDWLILGLGTTIFGTADRYYGDAAGRVGFEIDDLRLEYWDYDPSWAALGHRGDHVQVLNRRFAREVVGPSMIDFHGSGVAWSQ